MTKRFTGRHMLAVMITFFGTVIAVNMAMATLATRTFGGTVVDNSYVASQQFNSWLEQARAQHALGWSTRLEVDPARHVLAAVDAGGAPLNDAAVSAVATHPVGREGDVALRLEQLGSGRYRSTAPLPAGRWILRLTIERGADRMRLIESLG